MSVQFRREVLQVMAKDGTQTESVRVFVDGPHRKALTVSISTKCKHLLAACAVKLGICLFLNCAC